jgi:hypothetical protein
MSWRRPRAYATLARSRRPATGRLNSGVSALGALMKSLMRLVGPWLCIISVACTSQSDSKAINDITASATAQLKSDGSITVQKPTNDELLQANASARTFSAIDQLYPEGSNPPKGMPLSKATEVSVPGVVKLSDGRTIQMDGVRCSLDGVKSISHMALFDGVSIAFVPSTDSAPNPIPAQVWLVSEISLGPSYSPIAEVALTNGWCSPSPTSTNKYNDRYAALAKTFVGR